MKLTALKRFHASDIRGPEGRRTVSPGEEFEAPEETAKQLLERKLATEASGGTPSETSAARNAPVEAQPEVKDEPELPNKAEPAPKRKRKSPAEEEGDAEAKREVE